MVRVSVLAPFTGMPVGLKALAITGAVKTLTLAEAVPPVPPSTDVTLPVVLFFVPGVVPVTFTANVHEVLAANVVPARLIEFDPATAVGVGLQVLPARPFAVATTSPA